jgi:phosphatidylinositol alpha-1,6-mannosyltransferase
MEEFSYRLFEAYAGPKRLVALRRGQAWLPLFALRALVAARRCRGAVEHVHLGDAFLTPLAPAIARLTGAPVTATVHGLDVTRPVRPYRTLLRHALRQLPGRLIAVSSYTADQAAALYGVRTTVITNGVDVRRFAAIRRAPDPPAARAALGLPRTGPLLVTVGRLVERKGVAWFVERVLPCLPRDATYAVVGVGPYQRAVQRAAARDRRVTLLGEASDRTVAALYACADLFVAPNIAVPGRPEGYGIAPAEASAAGLPVLISGIEGLRDMAADTGVQTVPAGDACAWADAIRRALAGPDAFRARRAARSWASVAEEYARFFAAVGREHQRRPA